MKILEGLTVLSLEQAVAAPLATRHLADLGARVLKVEKPNTGDFARHYDHTVFGQSSYFTWLNSSKESLTLNLRHPKAIHLLGHLIQDADVFVQNLGPGTLSRYGFSLSEARDQRPQLITCSISGYGENGPYASRRAYDLLIQAETGLIDITGIPEAPAKVGIPIADIAAGMYAFSSILAALLGRHKTNLGCHIDISMLEALGEWLKAPWYYARYGEQTPGRHGTNHATISPYGEFRCAQGERIFLGVQTKPEWIRFCSDVLRLPDLSDDHRFMDNSKRIAHRNELHDIVNAVLGALDITDVISRLDRARIAYSQLHAIESLASHPQLRARGRTTNIRSSGKAIEALMPPFNISNVEVSSGGIPDIGQQTDTILERAGIQRGQIEKFRAEGVI